MNHQSIAFNNMIKERRYWIIKNSGDEKEKEQKP